MIHFKTCRSCGELFGTRSKSVGFCSDSCRVERLAEQRRRYRGSATIRPKIQSSTVEEKPCRQCGREFLPVDKRHKICSDSCRIERLTEQRRGYLAGGEKEKTVYRTYASRPCAVCEETFEPHAYNQITCSSRCRAVRRAANKRRSPPSSRPRRRICSARACDVVTNSTNPICREHLPRFDHGF